MGQRSHSAARCPRCHLHVALCLCALIPTLDLRTRVVLVMHHREQRRTTGSGLLALEALSDQRLLLHGLQDQPVDLVTQTSPERRGLLLFPGEHARLLSPELLLEDPRPVTLVVPDGSWRQASRAARRLPGHEQFEPVTLPEGAPTRYRLRHEPKTGGLATMEAIARALGILEGPQVQRALEALFDEHVERTLSTR